MGDSLTTPAVEPRWASTDLRWRNKNTPGASSYVSSSSIATPTGGPLANNYYSDRGFTEDYGDVNHQSSSNTKLFGFSNPILRLWNCCRNTSCSVSLVSAVASAACVLSIQFVDSRLVTGASGLTILLSIFIIIQQRKVRKLGTFRHENSELRRAVNFLRQERERLHRTLDRLDETVANLHSVPQELHKVCKDNNDRRYNADRLVQIVKEQKELQEKLRQTISRQVMQQILTIVIRVDRDKYWTLRPTEVEALIVRLGLVRGIEFNERRFRQLLKDDPTVTTIMRILRSLVERDDEYQHGEAIFKI